MKYEHIVFDIDGTLLDTGYAILHSLQETVRRTDGREIPLEELEFALGITGADALKKLSVKNIPSALALWEGNMRRYKGSIAVFGGVAELLEKLSAKGYRMGIVTSKTRKEYECDFIPFGIHRYFQTVVCADDTNEHKPAPEPLLKYMEWSGADAGKVLFVGDSEYDSECAKNAGTDFALAVWGSQVSYQCAGGSPATSSINSPMAALSHLFLW